ncbi:hypothetical protein M569_13567, partial [Genlisea aurea]
GNEEVKLATLSCLAAWAVKSEIAITPDVIAFIVSGLKEKETIRRGHLRFLRLLCKTSDTVLQISSLATHLIQLVKAGFTKAAQRLDGIYALLCILKIAVLDVKTDEIVTKEKIWPLIFLNEPTIIQIPWAAKLSIEDLIACIDLVEVLFLEYYVRLMDSFPIRALLQFILFLLCHPTWDIRKAAQCTARKILVASPHLYEAILVEFSYHLSTVGEKAASLKMSDTEIVPESFVPPVEIMVKALLVIASAASENEQGICVQLLLSSHHPNIVGIRKKDAVWRRVQKSLQKFHAVSNLGASISAELFKSLLGSKGLMSSNRIEQVATINSLSTLMSVVPGDTFAQFQEHFRNLPDLISHDELSEYDIQVFHTPDGVLTTDQGLHLGQPIMPINVSQAKLPLNARGNDIKKAKTAKEEAREIQLKEEGLIREKVFIIQRNVCVMLEALGEMAMANPIFMHSQLRFGVKYVIPLLRSSIVCDAAFETLLKLSRCTVDPLCNWALEIATALRIIATKESSDIWESLLSNEQVKHNPVASMSLFESLVTGLTISCKSGPLPVDSFTFIFPVIEKILLSQKKTNFHDDVLQILYLHLDPILPLPRIHMLSVLYHVLGVAPAYQSSICPALNELCLGLQSDEVAPALHGIYAKATHVRMACLKAVKCIPAVSNCSIPPNVEVATNIWLALHDVDKLVAEIAEGIWDCYRHDFGTDYSVLYTALSHVNYNVRAAAAEALAAALDESPDTIPARHSDMLLFYLLYISETLSSLFSLYLRGVGSGEENVDDGWLGRQGVALALHCAADVLRAKDLPVVMTFLISRALADPNTDVRGRMIDTGILIVDKHGSDNVSLLFPIFENFLNKKTTDEEKYDLVREGVVIFTGALAKHLSK